MKVVITMAGSGSRFREIGIRKPKHEIVVNGKTLFELSMLSLSDFFDEMFFFVVRKGCYAPDSMSALCDSMGIANYKIIEIDEITDGQARTVLKAEEFIDCNDSIIIYNIDTSVTPFILKKNELADFDGFIPCFEAEGEHWSFVRPSSTQRGVAVEVVEKRRVSNLASIGFYYFKSFDKFKELILENQSEIKSDYKELYIAPVYQYLINDGYKVGFSVIDKSYITNLGTPDEIMLCDSDYILQNR